MTVVATLYSLFVPPKYEASTIFSTPTETDISPLSLTQIGVQTYNPNELFYFFKKRLANRNEQAQFLKTYLTELFQSDYEVEFDHSRSTKQDEKTGDFEIRQLSWKLENRQGTSLHNSVFRHYIDLTVTSDPHNPDYLALKVTSQSSEYAHYISTHFPNYINSKIVESEVENLRGGIARSRENIKSLIEFKREVARRDRMDQIRKIEEALSIAENLGLEEPAKIPSMHTVVRITPPEQFFPDRINKISFAVPLAFNCSANIHS